MKVIYLINYAPQAFRGLMQNPDREAPLRALFESVGGKLTALNFTDGPYDLVIQAEVPDQTASMAVWTAARASGSVLGGVTLDVVDMPAVLALANKAVYTPAG
jgi:uncharacterized protein with GYD domain